MAQDSYQQRNKAVYEFLKTRGMGDQYQLAGGSHLMPSYGGMRSGPGGNNSRALQTAYGLYDLGLLGPGGLMMGGGSGAGSSPGPGGMPNIMDLMQGVDTAHWGPGWSQALQGQVDLGNRLASEEDLRRQQTIDMLQRDSAAAMKASQMTPEEINMRMGQVSDMATGESMRQMRGLREQLGSSGVTGGGAAMGLASGVELSRLGQIQAGKTTLALDQMQRRSQAAADNYMRSMGIAGFMAQGPSTKGQEAQSAVLDFLANIKLGERNIEASKYAARQQAKAAKTSAFGNILGSVIGAIF